MIHFVLGFIGGVVFVLGLSALDGILYRRAARRRFDREVERILKGT